jgi:hypothetical protein
MSRPTLCIVTAKTCPACVRYKNEQHDKVLKTFKDKGYEVKVFEVASTGDDLGKYNIPENLRKCIRWFPFFSVVNNNDLIAVFNGEKNGACYNHKNVGSKFPNPENLVEFYETSLTSQPNTTSVRPTGYVPTTACSMKFKGRLV